jgi:ubiquitin-like protein Pup
MPEREQMKRTTSPKEREQEVADVEAPAKQGEKIKEELDDLLDEIDSVLEDNAEDFVKAYVQKGGQ